MNIIIGLLIPFIGTTLGAAMLFFLKEKINKKILLGFIIMMILDIALG